MFQVLIESRALPTPRRGGWTVASVLVHAACIAGAVALTLHRGETRRADDDPFFPTVYVSAVPESGPVASGQHGTPRQIAPRHLPIAVPAIPTFDVGPDAAPSISPSEIAETFGPSLTRDSHGGIPAGGVFPERLVDRAVVANDGNGSPRYPSPLRLAGVEGEARVRFVVDSAGRVEPSSIEITHATHQLFADAVRQWIVKTRYSPAEAAGRRVRQLVEQRVNFTLER